MYNRNKRVISKVLSIILVITMILTGGVLNVFADFANKLMPLVENTSTIAEDESLREEYTKHFKMPDGSYSAISYTAPVHRKDANGNWVDIDNRMEETISKHKQAYVTSDGRMTFSKKINGSDNVVFNLSENGYGVKVSFNENDIKNTTAKLSNHAKKYVPNDSDSISEQYKKVKVIDNNTTIQYKNLIKGMTLEYVLSSNDIKENIIINEKQERYDYSFVYEFTGGLGAVLNDDGTVSLRDLKTDTDVYILPAPYMFDAEGNISENVEYQLTDLGNDKYSLNVIADSSWINDEKRAWPVVIDPTMSWIAGYYDTYIDSAHPNDNFGSSRELWVSSSRTTIMNHAFLPTIDDDVTINRATLNLSYYYNVSSGNVNVGLYQVTTNWQEHEVTWNSMSNVANGGISTVCRGTGSLQASSTINASSPGSAAINITEVVQGWYAGVPNYGIALKYRGGTNLSVILMSWETGNATRAKYEVEYSTSQNPIKDGKYYLQNVEFSNSYMQIDDVSNDTIAGVNFEIWGFNGLSNQTWNFEYLHNGYYKITSCHSQKVVSVPSGSINSEGARLQQETYDVSERQQWKITRTTDGLYKISPRSNPNYYIACSSSLGGANGRNIVQRSSCSDNKDEWEIHSITEYVFLDLPARIYHTPNMSTGYTAEQLNEMYKKATEDFVWMFNIKFSSASISSSNELIQKSGCEVSGPCTAQCGTYSSCATTHHKSSHYYNSKLRSSSYYTCRIVDFPMCSYDSTETYYPHNHVRGLGTIKGKDAVVTTVNPDGQVMNEVDIVYVIQHELTHNLGQAHDYCTPNQPCVLEGDVGFWCDACAASIRENY